MREKFAIINKTETGYQVQIIEHGHCVSETTITSGIQDCVRYAYFFAVEDIEKVGVYTERECAFISDEKEHLRLNRIKKMAELAELRDNR